MGSIGDKIFYYRKRRGLSRKDTTEGICDESTLFRIEKGESEPSIYIIKEICRKLNISVSFVFDVLHDDVKQRIGFIKQRCRKYVYYKEYNKLDAEINQLLEQRKPESPYNKSLDLFITWHQAILLHRRDNDPTSAKKVLEDSISVQPVLEVEISIMNTMGLICVSLEDKEKALHYFRLAFNALKTFPPLNDSTLYIRVGYNYASRLYFNRDYQKVMVIINELLDYLQIHHLSYMRGRISHLLAITYDKQGDRQKAEKFMKKAMTIFEEGNNMRYLEIAYSDLKAIQTVY